MIKTAIILAGGKGERLRPYTNDRPKVMVELADKPILYHQIEWLKSHGITKFVLTVSYKHEVIEEFLGDGSKFGIKVDYSVEEEPLGRGGAIKQGMKSKFCQGEKNMVVTNGDIITRFDLSEMVRNHEGKKGLVSILLVPYVSRWGIVRADDGHVIGFEEKPKLPYWINGGIYIFNKEVEPMLPEQGDHELETFPKIKKEQFLAFKDEGFWRAVDVIKDRSEAEEFIKNGTSKFY